MFRILAIILTAASIGGCTLNWGWLNPAARQDTTAEKEQKQREAYRERLLTTCDNIGLPRGTEAHASCVLSQHQQNIHLGTAVLPQQKK